MRYIKIKKAHINFPLRIDVFILFAIVIGLLLCLSHGSLTFVNSVLQKEKKRYSSV